MKMICIDNSIAAPNSSQAAKNLVVGQEYEGTPLADGKSFRILDQRYWKRRFVTPEEYYKQRSGGLIFEQYQIY